ncbi:MAG: helix-turn-helix transcriptional regulator [Halanaerobiales bacterium]|nr:helix-turn-helix transcriptional regulator [Halanaerobiales bacterium]
MLCGLFNKARKTLRKKSEILKALAHPIRLCILKGLMETKICNVTTMQYCLDLPQSTISQHLSKLKAANIIEGVIEGIKINYSILNEDAKKILSTIFEK